MSMVEDPDAKQELAKYTSNTNLKIKLVQLSDEERQLYTLLLTYMKFCYQWMEENSNIGDLYQVGCVYEIEGREIM